MKFVPAWFPGASFQYKAQEWKKLTLQMRDAPFDATKKAMVRVQIYGFSLMHFESY